MSKALCCIFLWLPVWAFAGGFYEGSSKGMSYNKPHGYTKGTSSKVAGVYQRIYRKFDPPPRRRFVCFDGRVLTCTPTGFVWQAKRGCFLSRFPCKKYKANIYGVYPTGSRQIHAFQRCREGYPFHLGEMQTH